jgi:hypothetical protein
MGRSNESNGKPGVHGMHGRDWGAAVSATAQAAGGLGNWEHPEVE